MLCFIEALRLVGNGHVTFNSQSNAAILVRNKFKLKFLRHFASTYRVIHLEVEQVEGASLALEQVLGLLDDGRDQPLEAHLLLKEAPGKGEKQL